MFLSKHKSLMTSFLKQNFDLTGKVALITGGNGGIGLGFAKGILKAGGDVCIWGRSKEKKGLVVCIIF